MAFTTPAYPSATVVEYLESLHLPETALTIAETILSIPPSAIFRGCFVFALTVVLALQLTPKISRGLILDYGPRATGQRQDDGQQSNDFFRMVTSYGRIPHSWFNHFYVASVLGSVFWGAELFLGGGVVMRLLVEWEVYAHATKGAERQGMAWEQVVLAWGMLAAQGVRRLWECYFVMRPSKSEMWFVHWIMGMCFYLGAGLAVWIEGADSILNPPSKFGMSELLTPQRILGVGVFAYGWTQQRWCHGYLAGLKKYTLPDEGLFRHIVCAHYFCECLIYLGITIAAAPAGEYVNGTMATASLFVFVNLASTASGTKKWYGEKFGAEKVAAKWKILPPFF